MKKIICLCAVVAMFASTVGCANRPIRSWFRGHLCNTCQPDLQPGCGPHAVGTCTDGCATPPAGIPQPVIQPALPQPTPVPTETNYYSDNDPTTQSYGGSQPMFENSGYGQLRNNGHVFGSGAAGNVLSPPSQPLPGPAGL